MNFIYETAVYCGRTKVWRVLNLNTGTVYSVEYESRSLALASIEDGTVRGSAVVKCLTLQEITKTLDDVDLATNPRYKAE